MAHLRNTAQEPQLKPADSSEALMQLEPIRHKSTDQVSQAAAASSALSSSAGIGWKPLSALAHPAASTASTPNTAMSQLSRSSSQEELPVLSTDGYHIPARIPESPRSFQCPVPPDVLKRIDPPYRQIDEFRNVIYTPVTCEPEEFALPESGFTLRQTAMGRRTELLIAITMYNESDEFLIRTLSAVFKNVRYFCELNDHLKAMYQRQSHTSGTPAQPPLNVGQTSSGRTFLKCSQFGSSSHLEAGLRGDQIWTRDGWQKIVVVIIADGRSKCHERVKKMLQVMGLFQDDIRMDQVVDPSSEKPGPKDVKAHLYELTCQSILESDGLKSGSRQGVVPVQMLFCLKEKNAKKLNSHKWLFRAIAPTLNPYVCALIDVGTRPKKPDAIYHLWKAFDRNLQIAGVCGEICVMQGKGCTKAKSIFHPLTASQNFEYKISNILDKTLESCFGYISVLPGAFSAYRWEALQDVSPEEGPLLAYFKGETPRPEGNVFSSNMYLAEDRILCFELVAKRNSKWILHYVKDAQAETDVPSTVHEFISQRRRWLNGTFFCQIYAIAHVGRFWNTKHGFIRKMALMLEYLYFAITIIFSWFALANFYLSFYMLTKEALGGDLSSSSWGGYLFDVLRLVYAAIIIAQFICAMGNRPQGAVVIYAGSMFLFSLIMMFLIVVTLILIFNNWPRSGNMSWLSEGGTARDVVLATVSTYGIYFLSALLYGQFAHIFTCIFQYLLLLPSYINTLTIYAFCNTHDISWGTKGDNKVIVGEGHVKSAAKSENEAPSSQSLMEPKPVLVSVQSESYQRALAVLREPPAEDQSKVDRSTQREDYYKNVRTWLVLAWVLTNGALVAVVSSPRISDALTSNGGFNPYMAVLMYAVAVFSLIRFIGCVIYLIKRMIRKY